MATKERPIVIGIFRDRALVDHVVKDDLDPNVWRPQIWGLTHQLFVGKRTRG
jgi:hypothetical protein